MDVEWFGHCFGKLPEASLLVTPRGEILSANDAARPLLPPGASTLQALALDPPESVSALLNRFCRSRELIPAALVLRRDGEPAGRRCRVEGGLLAWPGAEARLLLVRLFWREEANTGFAALNDRIEALKQEILDRRRAEARLHAEQEWFRTTLASIGDAVIATDVNGRITFLNGVAQAMTGWAQDAAAGLPLEDAFVLTSEITGLAVEAPVREVLRDGRIVQLANHTLLTARDGGQIPIEDSAAPIFDAAGSIIGVVLVFRDVSQRRAFDSAMEESVEALRRSEQTYRAIGESINYGVWVCEADGRNTYASQSFLDLVGITQRQCSDFGWGDVLHPDDSVNTIAAWQECVRTSGMWNVEHRFRGVDGRYHWVLARGCPILDSAGKVAQWAGINLDIDQAKAVEESLRVANQELTAANADLNHFAFAASHDLAEPLRMIGIYSQLLTSAHQEGASDQASLAVKVIADSTERMKELLADLLSYTQAGSAAGREPATLVDLNRALDSALKNLQGAVEQSGAAVTVGRLPAARGLEAHFVLLFQNLIANAIKYRSADPPRIDVSAEPFEGGWRVAVRDNGMGIDPKYHDYIFGVFKRLHSRKLPGTGIGLAMCQRVVVQNKGRIWVESALGEGAAFYFTLPR